MKRSALNSKKPGESADSSTDEKVLIESIERDASREAEKIDAQTRKLVEDRRKAVEQQIQLINRQADEKLRGKVAAIERNAASSIAVETRRATLRARETVMQDVINQTEHRLYSFIGEKKYYGILLDWIVEGAIGLNTEKAEVNASREEMKLINKDLLKEAEVKVMSLAGRKIDLTKSRQNPLLAQGVVLKTDNDRLAFNNQVPTRFLRYQSEIRKLITSELFE